MRPTEINLYHNENETVVHFYIFLGENLLTNSSALPLYRNIYMWKSNTINFSFAFGHTVNVPETIFLGENKITIFSTLIIESRKSVTENKTYSLFVKRKNL